MSYTLSATFKLIHLILKEWGTSCVFYLWTVWEATRKDIRSPGDISLLEIKVPPAKIVPSTMPVLTAHNTKTLLYWISWYTVPICPTLCLSVSKIHSQFRVMFDSPWKTAIPVPRFSFISHDLSTSYAYNLEKKRFWKSKHISDIQYTMSLQVL